MLHSHFAFHSTETLGLVRAKEEEKTVSVVCVFQLGKSLSFPLSPLRTLINAVYKTKSCDLQYCG